MKKFISVFLAVLMLAGVYTTAVGADFTVGGSDGISDPNAFNGSASQDVVIQVGGVTIHKYAVDITFSNMVFVYGGSATWDPNNHVYVTSPDAEWTEGSIIITNHSDLAIAYETSIEEEGAMFTTYGVHPVIGNDTGKVDACAVNGTPPSVTLPVTIEGAVQNLTTAQVKIAEITVFVRPVE